MIKRMLPVLLAVAVLGGCAANRYIPMEQARSAALSMPLTDPATLAQRWGSLTLAMGHAYVHPGSGNAMRFGWVIPGHTATLEWRFPSGGYSRVTMQYSPEHQILLLFLKVGNSMEEVATGTLKPDGEVRLLGASIVGTSLKLTQSDRMNVEATYGGATGVWVEVSDEEFMKFAGPQSRAPLPKIFDVPEIQPPVAAPAALAAPVVVEPLMKFPEAVTVCTAPAGKDGKFSCAGPEGKVDGHLKDMQGFRTPAEMVETNRAACPEPRRLRSGKRLVWGCGIAATGHRQTQDQAPAMAIEGRRVFYCRDKELNCARVTP